MLTDAERKAIMEDEGRDCDYWRFYLLTGLRLGELSALRAEDVHLNAPAPFARIVGKGRKVRNIPLEGETLATARRLVMLTPNEWVFPRSRREISRRWKRERERLGLAPDVTLHVFRHDFISRLANDGRTPLPVLQRLVGHANLATTATYVHEDPSAMRQAMRRRSEDLSEAAKKREDDELVPNWYRVRE